MKRNPRLSFFDQIIAEAIEKGLVPYQTDALRWYKIKTRQLGKHTQPRHLWQENERWRRRAEFGKMYHFYYDAKTKDKLPYYDKFPLVFPLSRGRVPGGFLGLNLHYLPLRERALFMQRMYDFVTDDAFDQETAILATYRMIRISSRYKYFRPCIKRYYYANMKSRLIEINPIEWNIALFLPTDRFVGAQRDDVWEDSLKKI